VQNDLSLVQIGIATKNRWDDLKVTLEKIRDFGLGGLRIIIFDDHSIAACPFDVRAICSGAEIKRFDISRGYIIRRNEIAATMDSKYYLSLDDDSFPSAGSLEEAVAYAESLTDNFCLGFPIYSPLVDTHFEASLQAKPCQVRSFVGCSHLLDRQRFLDLGGYREELIHQTEENEIAVRAFQQGLLCRRFSGLQITHMATNVGRSFYRMDFYGGRNTLLWNDWYLPPEQKLVRQGRTFASRLYYFAATRRLGYIQGGFAGLRDIRRYRSRRRPLSLEQYRNWRQLPPS
jgi:GT2 family glycosyltransferase